ncbi:MAG: class I SAM-dependent DNA methyltransferase, partial [Betaproteobacteria bacterium]|nr:class I SAM-dependent DNA methyltransferase [Betaproteobacteria bacterium]
ATLAKAHPFTFLDHSLRAGDSLVGLGRKQISALHWAPQKQLPLVAERLTKAIDRAGAYRRDILEGGDFLSPALKKQKLDNADDALEQARLIGDCVIAAFFSADKPAKRQVALDRLALAVDPYVKQTGDWPKQRGLLADLANWLHGRPRDPAVALSPDALSPEKPISQPVVPFHWEIEFPEVFGRVAPGFDAVIGNPPFLGGPKLSELFGGPEYQDWLKDRNHGAFGNADLCAYFFRMAFDRTRVHGAFGFLATNSIYEGGTRTTGLQHIVRQGGTIYSARRALRWPGEAAVIVSVVHIAGTGARLPPEFTLDDVPAQCINSRLHSSLESPDPVTLRANDNLGFMGAGLRSNGFVLAKEEFDTLWTDPTNRPCLMPLLGGEEVNTSPTQTNERYAINFGSQTLEEASQFPTLLEIVRTRVKPDRDRQKDHGPGLHGKKYWWQYALRSDPLYDTIRGMTACLVTAITTTHLAFSFQPTRQVFTHSLVVCAIDRFAPFACVQCRAHEHWAIVLSSTLGEGLRYSVSDALQTFPFPENFETDARLEAVGKEYYEFRAALMVKNDEGLTKTYNRFHDPGEASAEIARLRELHAAM